MITLKHALKITNNARVEDNSIRLMNIEFNNFHNNWLTMKNVLDYYDLKKVMVYKIKPDFDFYGNYNGMVYYCRIDKENR